MKRRTSVTFALIVGLALSMPLLYLTAVTKAILDAEIAARTEEANADWMVFAIKHPTLRLYALGARQIPASAVAFAQLGPCVYATTAGHVYDELAPSPAIAEALLGIERPTFRVTWVARHPHRDIALIRFVCPWQFPLAKLHPMIPFQLDGPTYLSGCWYANDPMVSQGLMTVSSEMPTPCCVTASAGPGASGGGAFDKEGRLWGVITCGGRYDHPTGVEPITPIKGWIVAQILTDREAFREEARNGGRPTS